MSVGVIVASAYFFLSLLFVVYVVLIGYSTKIPITVAEGCQYAQRVNYQQSDKGHNLYVRRDK